MDNVLSVQNLCKSYGDFALRDVSFDVPAGTITGLIGANGAGKTTTLRVLLGLAPSESGSVRFFDSDSNASDPGTRARIGAVLDGGGFFDDLTAQQMASLIAPAYPDWSKDDYRQLMDMFALDPRKKVKTLSKGMRAKLALVLALSHRADLLIMDEPTSGLDPMTRRELLDVLVDFLGDTDRAVLLSTHITSDLDRIADSIILMDNGEILFQENKDELLDSWRICKGTSRPLPAEAEPLLSDVHTTPFGFTAMTHDPQALKALVPDIVLEPPTIDDIMAACAGMRHSAQHSEAKGGIPVGASFV